MGQGVSGDRAEGALGDSGDRRDGGDVHGGSGRSAGRGGRGGGLADRGVGEGVRGTVRDSAGVRRLGEPRPGRGPGRGVRRHPALRAPGGRRPVSGGGPQRAVREAVHAQRARGGGTGRAGPRGRPLPDGSDVDVLQPAGAAPQGAGRRRRDRRGAQRPGGLRTGGSLPARAPAARPRAGRRRPPGPGRVPGVLHAVAARRALGHRGARGPLRRGRRPPDGRAALLRRRRARLGALLHHRRHAQLRLGHRVRRAHRRAVRLLLPGPLRAAPRRQGARGVPGRPGRRAPRQPQARGAGGDARPARR